MVKTVKIEGWKLIAMQIAIFVLIFLVISIWLGYQAEQLRADRLASYWEQTRGMLNDCYAKC